METTKKQAHQPEAFVPPSGEVDTRLQQIVTYQARQQRLMQLVRTIISSLHVSEIWLALTSTAQELLAANRVAVFIFDEETVSCPHAFGLSTAFIEQSITHFQQTIYNPVRQHQSVKFDNIKEYPDVTPTILQEGIHSFAVFPLKTSQQLLGGLAIYRDVLLPFTPEDMYIGEELSHFGAIALENAERYSHRTYALMRVQKFNQMARTLNRTEALPAILARLIRMAMEIVQADAGSLGLLLEDDTITFYPHNLPPALELKPSQRGIGVAWDIVESGHSYLLLDYQNHVKALPELVEAGLRAFIGVPIVAADGERIGALGLFRFKEGYTFTNQDLTIAESFGLQAGVTIQETRLYAESKARNQSLSAAIQRLEALDEMKTLFLENVSHELRTPLGLIYGHAELLESGALGTLTPIQANSIEIIGRRARMLGDFIEDLMALMAAEAQEFRQEVIDTTHLLQSILLEFQMKAENNGRTLQAALAPDLPKLIGDPVHLRRVFDNLLGNAFKFTPEGGTITVDARRQGQHVIIDVTDTGVGIPPDKVPYIFERFYQVDRRASKEKYGGLGLGLALVKEIVEGHEGWLTVDSEVGQGTTFQVVLPANDTPLTE